MFHLNQMVQSFSFFTVHSLLSFEIQSLLRKKYGFMVFQVRDRVMNWLKKLENWKKQSQNVKRQFCIQISSQKCLLNQQVNKKQKAVKILQQKFREVKNNLDCKMSLFDYVYICNASLVSNNKIIFKIKETQKLRNLLFKNMSKNSNIC